MGNLAGLSQVWAALPSLGARRLEVFHALGDTHGPCPGGSVFVLVLKP